MEFVLLQVPSNPDMNHLVKYEVVKISTSLNSIKESILKIYRGLYYKITAAIVIIYWKILLNVKYCKVFDGYHGHVFFIHHSLHNPTVAGKYQ